MSILDSLKEWVSSETSRNKQSSIISGLLFFSGWWILIDAMSVIDHQITTAQVFIGVFATVSFFMVNSISDDNLSESGSRIAKVWLLTGFVMGFACIIASIWVMIEYYFNNKQRENWAGVALLLQNILILLGSLTYKFGKNEELWSE